MAKQLSSYGQKRREGKVPICSAGGAPDGVPRKARIWLWDAGEARWRCQDPWAAKRYARETIERQYTRRFHFPVNPGRGAIWQRAGS